MQPGSHIPGSGLMLPLLLWHLARKLEEEPQCDEKMPASKEKPGAAAKKATGKLDEQRQT